MFIPLVRLFSIQSPSPLFQFHFSVRTLIQFFYFFLLQFSLSSDLSFSLSISPTEAGERGLGISAIARRKTSEFRSGYECLAVDKGRSTIAEERGEDYRWLTCNVGKNSRERNCGTDRERHRSFGGFCTARIPRSLLQFPPSLALCRNLFLFSSLSSLFQILLPPPIKIFFPLS